MDSAGPIVKVSCIQHLICSRVKFTLESVGISSGTPLVEFSRSDSEGFVYAKIDFDTFFSKVSFYRGIGRN